VLYLVAFSGRHAKEWLPFFALAPIPVVLWTLVSRDVGVPNSPHSGEIGRWTSFTRGPLEGWAQVVAHPVRHAMTPWVSFHVGWEVSLLEISSMIYWFLLVALGYALYRFRPAPWERPASRIVLLVVVSFFAMQLMTAAFLWENNPRRTIPLLFAFGYAATWAVWRAWDSRPARWAIGGLAVLTGIHSFADVLFGDPAIALAQVGQAIDHGPMYILPFDSMRLDAASLPRFPEDGPHAIFQYHRAIFGLFCLPQFLGTQAVLFVLFAAFFYWLGRGGVLPRRSAEGWVVLYVLSLATRAFGGPP
jgi:hypothetical protein